MVEIIPKSFEEIPSWQRILFYFLILLLIGIGIGYFILGNLQAKSEDYLETLEQRLFEEGASRISELEDKILVQKTKIDDFSFLLERHVFASKFFDFIESKTHPNIFFSEIDLEPETFSAFLSGNTSSFLSLGQQMVILEKDELIEDVVLRDVSVGTKGGIDFTIGIVFKEELIRYSLSQE